MNTKMNRWLTNVVAVLVVSLALLLVASTVMAHFRVGQPSVKASAPAPAPLVEYSKDHDVGRLYFSLAMLPQNSRKPFYSQFTVEQKRAVWLLHLTLTQLNTQSPTAAQLAVFQKVAVLIRRADFDDLSKNAGLLAEAQAVNAAAVAAFGPDEARALFTELGSAVKLKSAYGQSARFDGACECNDFWNYCGDRRHCEKGLNNCTEASSGCGFLWVWSCNGNCKDDGSN